MYYWQKEPEPAKVKVRAPIGEIYLKGFADGFHGRPAKKPRGKRAREAYDKGFSTGQATKNQGNKPMGLTR